MKAAWLLLLYLASMAHAAPDGTRIQMLPRPADIPLPSNVRVFFAPGDNLEGVVVTALDQASTEILISQSAITSKKIGDAIVRAFRRKVVVGIILKENPPIADYETPAFFEQNQVPYVFAVTKWSHNQKYGIIDRRIVLTGSYDWMAFSGRNNENLLVLDEPGIAAAYARDWLDTARKAKIPAP
jgi:phosphatidylserine/phosphatidylglycerophosphate/cardiolipin synthase-like enzyme